MKYGFQLQILGCKNLSGSRQECHLSKVSLSEPVVNNWQFHSLSVSSRIFFFCIRSHSLFIPNEVFAQIALLLASTTRTNSQYSTLGFLPLNVLNLITYHFAPSLVSFFVFCIIYLPTPPPPQKTPPNPRIIVSPLPILLNRG